jgi:hypothetical protein
VSRSPPSPRTAPQPRAGRPSGPQITAPDRGGPVFRDATAHIEERIAGIADPAERIAVYVAEIGSEMRRLSQACYDDMVANDSTRDVYALNSAAAARRVRGFIRDGISQGKLRTVHAEFAGEPDALLIEGIQHGELLNRTGLSSGDAFGQLSDLVLAALTNKSG